MAALVYVSLAWEKVKWWWHNTWYSFPIIGKIASLARDPNKIEGSAWFKAERTLCRDYKKFIQIQDEHDFNENITYLTKAGDNGRRTTPSLIWLLIIGFVFVEAMGFSYVIAGYAVPGASENYQQLTAYGLAFLVSALLVLFTHFAGQELYKSGQIKQARQEWVEAGRKGPIHTGDVALANPQSKDDAHPSYVHLINRVGKHPTYKASIATVILIAVVAVLATYVRGQVLEKQLHLQTIGQTSTASNDVIQANKDSLNMSNKKTLSEIQLPADDAEKNRKAIEKAASEDANIDRHGGWGTFIFLAFIFVFLQILGIMFGYRWEFAGKDSKDAFRAIGAGRYSSYSGVREHYKDIADTAQSKLEHLQQQLMERNGASGTDGLHTKNSFYDFMESERGRETEDRVKALAQAAKRGAVERAVTASAIAQVSLDETMNSIHSMGEDKEAKKNYIHGLPDALKAQVIQTLKTQKEAQVKKSSQVDAELDNLLG